MSEKNWWAFSKEPSPVEWPDLTEDHFKLAESVLGKQRADIMRENTNEMRQRGLIKKPIMISVQDVLFTNMIEIKNHISKILEDPEHSEYDEALRIKDIIYENNL